MYTYLRGEHTYTNASSSISDVLLGVIKSMPKSGQLNETRIDIG